MNKLAIAMIMLGMPLALLAQQEKARESTPNRRAEAQKGDAPENWTLSEKAWDFKDVLTAYEPVKGHLETRGERGDLAVWKLRLTKDFEEGAQRFHEELRGSPFKIVLLDADRTTINPDLPASITPVPSRMDDTIEMYVALPSAEVLRDVKHIRVQRRTDVGF
jgi:hypothetical protein